MTAPWFVVKYVPDLYRQEPRNVGIVLLHEGTGHVRFLGQDPETGDLDIARVQSVISEIKTYQAWVRYFSHHAHLGTWHCVQESLSRRPFDNFLVEEGGSWELDFETPDTLLTELFRTMVARRREASTETMPVRTESLVKRVFEAAQIDRKVERKPDFDVEVRGRLGTTRTTISFDYMYANGSVTLMERMPLAAKAKSANFQRVNDLLYRIDRLTNDAPVEINRFIALYHVSGAEGEEAQEAVERELSVLETCVDVVDVSNVPEAASNLRQRLTAKR